MLNEMPRPLAPSTLLVEAARRELFFIILGGEVGESADWVIKVAQGTALFSMSLRLASKSAHFWAGLAGVVASVLSWVGIHPDLRLVVVTF